MQREPVTISFWRGVLPHWELIDGHYFVTLRLAGSLPRTKVDELRAMLKGASEADYLKRSRRYFMKMEAWLDADRSTATFARQDVAQRVVDGIAQCEAMGYWHIISYVVMPNHLHVFFTCGTLSLSAVMERFKRYTARSVNHLLNRKGRLWQREWFDHWSRSVQEDDQIISYIQNNPVRSGLVAKAADWPWGQ